MEDRSVIPPTGENPFLSAALEWADRGFDVLPLHSIDDEGVCTCAKSDCSSPGKHPRTRRGFHDASRDPKIIEVWFQKWRLASVGVVPGSGRCVVIDIDPRNIETNELRDWMSVHEDEFANAPTVLTGEYPTGRGRHIWLRSKVAAEVGVGQIRDGIEWKASSGYVLVPPSRHAGGSIYEHAAGSFEAMPNSPDWLDRLVATKPIRESEGAGSNDQLTGIPISPFSLSAIEFGLTEPKPGQTQRDSAVGVARNLRESGTPYDLVVVLMRKVLLHPDACLRSEHPWANEDVLAIVRSVFAEHAPDHAEHLALDNAKFKVQTLADAAKTAEQPIDWLVRDLLAVGEKAMLVAPPKAKKTFLALHLARCVATGQPFLEESNWSVDAPGAVLFVQEEHAPQQWAKRLRKVFDGAMDAPFYFMHRTNISLNQEPHVDALIERARSIDARLIIIDPWQRVIPGVNENDAADTQPAWTAVHRLAHKTNAVVLVIHHTNKGDGELRMDMARGSSRMAGEVDLILVARKVGSNIELFMEGRDVENALDGNLEIAHDPDMPHRMRTVGIKIKAKSRNATRSALETILRGADRPLTTAETQTLVTEATKKSVTRQTIDAHLNRLLDEGTISKVVREDGRRTSEWAWVTE